MVEIEDQSCGILFAKETGAYTTDIKGKNLKIKFSKILPSFIVSRNKKTHNDFLQSIKELDIYGQL